ncbi:MAG TPA: DUF3306 domain-containing protein [Rhabdaerophilum sp.]|nr:DUF3306 domain-containing protein [Rhabdaerophilum sp.]
MSERENFLSRWSKRKQAVAEAEKNAPADNETVLETTVAEEEPFDPASLPSLESLTAEADFTPFLRKNVPPALRNAALRRMWSLDPYLQGPDVLADYAWDFNSPEVVTGFGELAPGTDTQAMLRWITGEEATPKPVPDNTAEEAVASVGDEPANVALPPDSAVEESGEADGAAQHQKTETTEQFANPVRNRRHGGALPN